MGVSGFLPCHHTHYVNVRDNNTGKCISGHMPGYSEYQMRRLEWAYQFELEDRIKELIDKLEEDRYHTWLQSKVMR